MADPYAFPPEEDEAPAPASLDELNEPQARAAAHVDGPLLIFAGAGSGKTRVIVYRIANLVAVHRVPPYRVLAVTFTNKAAGEMRTRLQGLLGEGVAKDLWVGTFHAVCVKLLRRYHDAAGLGRNFVIYDDSDQRTVMNRVVKALQLDDKRFPPRQVLSRIHAREAGGQGAGALRARERHRAGAQAQCFEEYQRHLKEANAVDFDDILLAVLRLVEDPESLAGQEIRGRFWYVLVDEFQDVNQVQYRLVRAFAGERKNLCVVGDDDQSIYRWRGADVRIVRGFRRDFPDAMVVKLEQNYRSTRAHREGGARRHQARLGPRAEGAVDRQPRGRAHRGGRGRQRARRGGPRRVAHPRGRGARRLPAPDRGLLPHPRPCRACSKR